MSLRLHSYMLHNAATPRCDTCSMVWLCLFKFDGASKSTAGAAYEFMQPTRLVPGDGLIFTIGWCFTHVSRHKQGRPDDVLTARERREMTSWRHPTH